MRISILAIIVAVTLSSAADAATPPRTSAITPAATVAHGGKVAYCKMSSLGEDRARLRIVVATTSKVAREVTVPITIPDGFVVTGLSVSMTGEEAVVGKPRLAIVAREKYEQVVRQLIDPALLEWKADGQAVLRVFPVTRRVSATVTLELAMQSTEIGARLDRQTSLVAVPASADDEIDSDPNDRYFGYWPNHVVEDEVTVAQLR